MFLHAALEGGAHPAQLFSSDDIGQQIAETKFDVGLGQKNMGQPIQEHSFQSIPAI
jgi:hypothetical protein